MEKDVRKLAVGDVIGDMHDHLIQNNKPFNLLHKHRETFRVRVAVPTGSKFIEDIVNHERASYGDETKYQYCNKYIVVLQEPDIGSDGIAVIKAGWSYDGRNFGMLTVTVDMNQPRSTGRAPENWLL